MKDFHSESLLVDELWSLREWIDLVLPSRISAEGKLDQRLTSLLRRTIRRL